MKRSIFENYPDILACLEKVAGPHCKEEIKNLIELVGEIRYRDGFIDGIKRIVREMLNSQLHHLAPALLTLLLAERVCSWPYGVLMSVRNVF